MKPAMKRFIRDFGPIADAVARLDLDQEDREQVAASLGDALDGRADFRRDLFVLLASDPLVPCAGYGDQPCPHERVIRIAMHLSSAPDGRSEAVAAARPLRRDPLRYLRCERVFA